MRINEAGDVLLNTTYPSEGNAFGYSIYECEESGFVVAGKETNSGNGLNSQMLLLKIFNDGTLIWRRTYGGTAGEIAYDVKETKNYGFALVGQTTANNDYGDIFLVTTDDFGDSVSSLSYGDTLRNEGKSVCITDDDYFVIEGGETSSITNQFNLTVSIYYYCASIVPKGLWFMDCWHFNTIANVGNKRMALFHNNPSGGIAGTQAFKTANFVNYCQKMKIHTVVLGHLEDILREDYMWNGGANHFSDYPDDWNLCSFNGSVGSQLRTDLKNLVTALHNAGVSLVFAQWLDQTPEIYGQCITPATYQDDESQKTITHNHEILEAFKELNKPTTSGGTLGLGFDGLMLDYEYFAPDYGFCVPCGTGTHTDFQDAKTGFGYSATTNWMDLAGQFIAANNTNGIKFVRAYLNHILFTDPISTNSTNNFF